MYAQATELTPTPRQRLFAKGKGEDGEIVAFTET